MTPLFSIHAHWLLNKPLLCFSFVFVQNTNIISVYFCDDLFASIVFN